MSYTSIILSLVCSYYTLSGLNKYLLTSLQDSLYTDEDSNYIY